jgi:diguanylate cyclase (GGDEF)-like protein
MELSQDVLLPILIATIVANAAIILILLASGRLGRRKTVAVAGTQAPSYESSVMTTSYSDRSAASIWSARTEPGPTQSSADGTDDPMPEPVEPTAEAGPAPVVVADIPAAATVTTTASASEPVDPIPPAPVAAAPIVPEAAAAAEATATIEGVDELTGLPDAAAFSRSVMDEDARIARYHRPATVVIFELEGLDRLAERLGPGAGERVVAAVADTVRRLARSADHVARVAPGRFAVLLPETDEVVAINYIERVRRACELWLETGAIATRLAIGWAGSDGDTSLPDAQRVATDRMYTELRRGPRRGEGLTDPERTGG